MKTMALSISLAFVVLLAALVAPAGASSVTSPAGSTFTFFIEFESEGHVVLHSENAPTPFTAECNSEIFSRVESHGKLITASGISAVSFSNCTNSVSVRSLRDGVLAYDALGGGNGTVTSTGLEFEVAVGLLGIRCIYYTQNTDIGLLTGSTTTKSLAKLDFSSATINRSAGSAFCGTGGFWTGTYKAVSPAYVDID